MKKIILLISLLLVGCETTEQFENLEPPIIIAAESERGDILIRTKDSEYMFIYHELGLAKALAKTYEVGDTIK